MMMDLTEIRVRESGLDSPGAGYSPIMGLCDHSSEPSRTGQHGCGGGEQQ
jgi:hypothetical protein